MDIGFEAAGFKSIWTNEFNPAIADLFGEGMSSLTGKSKAISSRSSILDLSPATVLNQSMAGSSFGVIGGPPCPDFSIAGKQRGGEGANGQLTACYISMIIGLNPTFFVMENVPGLVGTAKHMSYLKEQRQRLHEAGFVTDTEILNALELGVPQDRQRFFMVGFRRDCLKNPPPMKDGNCFGSVDYKPFFPFPRAIYQFAKTRHAWPDKSPFGATPPVPDVPIKLTVKPYLDGAELLPNGNDCFTAKSKLFTSVEEGDVDRKSCKRLHRYRYSPTACYGNNEVHFHPWLARRLSVREALRIQSVPDEYVLPEEATLSSKFKMVGNGVPCKLAKALACMIMKFLKEEWIHAKS